jgi:Membrane protein involved in the export of O-antigen and teichoic acid
MKKQKSIKKNFIYNTFLTMTNFIFPLITFPYVSRILMPSGTGKVSFAVSLISYFTMLSQLGMPTYGIRTCSKVRNNRKELTRTVHELLCINLIMCVVSYILLGLALIFVPALSDDRLLYIIVSFTILLTSIGMEWLYKALEQYRYIAIRSIVFKFIALLAMFLLVHEQEDYIIYGFISIFAASASNIFNFINVRKYIDLKRVGNYHVKRHLRPLAIFFAMSCATTIYTHMDTLMLGFMLTKADVGFYNAAVRIKSLLLSIVTSLGAVLLPRSSFLIQTKQWSKFRTVSRKALDFVFIISSALMLYFILYAKYGIWLLSGGYYSPSIIPMKIIMPTLLFIGVTNITGIQIMVPLGKEKSVLLSEIVGMVINLIINALLIPQMKSTGAAIGTLAAEFAVLIVQYFAMKSEISHAFRAVSYWKIALGLAAGTLCSFWIMYLELSNFFTLAFTTLLFFGAYAAVLLVTHEWLMCDLVGQLLAKISKLFNKYIKKNAALKTREE